MPYSQRLMFHSAIIKPHKLVEAVSQLLELGLATEQLPIALSIELGSVQQTFQSSKASH